jgi:hypothetical protein
MAELADRRQGDPTAAADLENPRAGANAEHADKDGYLEVLLT